MVWYGVVEITTYAPNVPRTSRPFDPTPQDSKAISTFAAKLGDASHAAPSANIQVSKQTKEATIQTSKAIKTISDHHFTRGLAECAERLKSIKHV